jgi:predicted transcriptional regulator
MRKSKLTPEQAQAVLDKHDLNVIEKVSKGGTLSATERETLQAIASKTRQNSPTPETDAGNIKKIERDYLKELTRRKVYEMRLRGMSLRDMAAELGVSKEKVHKALKEVNGQLLATLKPLEAQKLMNESLKNFDFIIQEATKAIATAQSENGRAAFMNALDRATQNRAKLIQEMGLVDVAPIRVETSGPGGATAEVAVTLERPVPEEDMISLLNQWQAEHKAAG